MVPKQLIVAVEGTAAVGPFWQTIVSDYLDKIIRSFCGSETAGQKSSTAHFELSLVMFNAHGSYSACLVQRSGWTKDMDIFFQWLSAIPFAGGGFNDAAIAEGLSEALMMFSSPNGNQNQNLEGQRHCILVAASNPYPLPTPVFRPQIQNPEKNDSVESQPDNRLSDAETLAKSFAQCAVSLSVICPKQLPKLRGIYNAGKRNPRAADPPVDSIKNPHFLVLISENFIEARSSVSRSGITSLPPNQNPTKMDVTPAPPISGPPPVSVPSANGSLLARQPVPAVNIPPAIVKLEPPTIATSVTGTAFPHIPSVPRAAPQSAPTLQTSSPISTSQEVIPINDNIPEMKPLVANAAPPPSMRPAGGAAANVRILNDMAQARQALAAAGGTSIGLGGTSMLSNMISSGMTSSIPSAQISSGGPSSVTSISGPLPMSAAGQVAQNSVSAPFISTGSNASGNSSVAMSQQPLGGLQGSVVPSQTGNIPVAQMVQTGMGMNVNMMSGGSGSGGSGPNGSMIPTPGMSQQGQPGMQQPGGVNSNSVANTLNQQTSATMQSAQSKYIRVWEGNLSGQRQGQPVFITRLEGYRSASASETLAANWPSTMQIVRLISQDHMNNKQYVGKADFLVFRAMNQHGFLGQLQEKKLCAVIQLPSQTLLLSVSDKAHRLIGMLFPGDMVVFKPQIPNNNNNNNQQQQQQQMQVQLQQQLQQQNLQQQQQPLMQIQQQQQQIQQQQQQIQQQQQQQMPQMQQQQMPQMQQQQMNQAYMSQGAPQRSQIMSQGGQASSQGPPPTMPGGPFMN